MSNVRITYAPRPDATPETEAAALAAVYHFLLDQHAKKKGGVLSTAPNDRKARTADADD